MICPDSLKSGPKDMREKEFLPSVASSLGIGSLNTMQRRMLDVASESRDVVLLSPTGSGKTLAFILPVLKLLRPSTGRVQAVVIAPSRELVLQISDIIRRMGVGVRCVAVYGGHSVEDESNSLRVTPDILVGTPGRLLDHAVRGNVDLRPVRICVLDEFDKSLELGFEKEMERIFSKLKNVSRIFLTSATPLPGELPDFLKLNNPLILSYLKDNKDLKMRLRVCSVASDSADKLDSLYSLLASLAGDGKLDKTMVFVNHRESAERVASYLKRRGVSAVLYHGALDQRDREKALALFRNGSRNVLVCTDLAARGLDIEGVEHVIHYHQPLTAEAYTHRNGRTARVDAEGSAYLLLGPDEQPAGFVELTGSYRPVDNPSAILNTGRDSIYIGAGRKDKLSKGDILGWLTKDLGIPGSEVGAIDLADRYAMVTLPADTARDIALAANSQKIKGQKRLVRLITD